MAADIDDRAKARGYTHQHATPILARAWLRIAGYFTPETIWENVGMATTTGPEDALALMAQYDAAQGVTHFGVETLAIATQGGTVLTERIDTMLGRADGAAVTLRLTGIFELEGGHIADWRDNFETAALAAAGWGARCRQPAVPACGVRVSMKVK